MKEEQDYSSNPSSLEKSNSKGGKLLWIIGIIVFVLVIALGTIFYFGSEDDSNGTEQENFLEVSEVCSFENTQSLQSPCIIVNAKKGLLADSACDEVFPQDEPQCLYLTARSKKDKSACNGLNPSLWKTLCEVAYDKNPEGCRRIANDDVYGDSVVPVCYEELAILNEDPSICDNIGTWDSYSTEGDRIECYTNYAVVLNDIRICDTLEESVAGCKQKVEIYNR